MKLMTVVIAIGTMLPAAAMAQQPGAPGMPGGRDPNGMDCVPGATAGGRAGAGAGAVQGRGRQGAVQGRGRAGAVQGRGRTRAGTGAGVTAGAAQGRGRASAMRCGRGGMGGDLMMDRLPELRQQLNLTDDQVAKMQDIADKAQKDRREDMQKQRDAMQKDQDRTADQREKMMQEMRKNQDEVHKKMLDVLTDAQRKQLEDMRANGRQGGGPGRRQ